MPNAAAILPLDLHVAEGAAGFEVDVVLAVAGLDEGDVLVTLLDAPTTGLGMEVDAVRGIGARGAAAGVDDDDLATAAAAAGGDHDHRSFEVAGVARAAALAVAGVAALAALAFTTLAAAGAAVAGAALAAAGPTGARLAARTAALRDASSHALYWYRSARMDI